MMSYEFLNTYGLSRQLLTKVTNFQVDSRQVRTGSIFFALKGAKTSGEFFLRQVAENGGICAFVSPNYNGPDFGLKLIKVEDPLIILQKMAKEKRGGFNTKIVGVTGSVGKTTTKEFIAQLIAADFDVSRNTGNANSQIGLPLTILNFARQYEVLVLEMAMSKAGQIKKLASIAQPEIAIITKVGYAHAENFANFEQIVEAKSEVFTQNAAIKIADHDLIQYSCIKKHQPLTFSMHAKNANFYLDLKKKIIYENSKEATLLAIPFQETSFLHDLLGAIAIARQLGVSYETIKSRFSSLRVPSKRFEKITINDVLFINDAYNSNPSSLKAALENLKLYQKRKIAVLGPMLELGKYSEEKHFELGKIAAKNVDMLLTIGSECKPLYQAFLEEKSLAFYFSDLSSLALKLKQELKRDDIVLIKGSNAIMLEKLFELI